VIEERDPITQQPEGGEPSGEQSAAAEREMLEATEAAAAEGVGSRVSGAGDGDSDPAPRTSDPAAELQAERDKYLDLAQRTQADFENYRKRAAKDAASAGERAKAGLVRELLPVLDNLERALATGNGDVGSVVEGVKLVHADLVGVLQRSGVEPFDPAGEQFDPTVHEALSTRPVEGTHPGMVVDVVEKGYKLNDTVLRPARVVVSQ
jgi:molecular chaperone GrpE